MTSCSCAARSLFMAVVCGLTLAACNGPTNVAQQPLLELASRHNQWAALEIRDYAFDYSVAGFAVNPPVRIEVIGGKVVRVTNLSTSAVMPNPATYPTIESLFSMAADVLTSPNYDHADVDYNGPYGFPAVIDAPSQYPDGGFTAMAGHFEKLTLVMTVAR